MSLFLPVVLLIFICTATDGAALGQPSLSGPTPGGLVPGKSQELVLQGDKLVPPLTLWSAANLAFEQIEPAADHKSVKCRVTPRKGDAVGIVAIVAANASGASNPLLLMIDDLASVADHGNNHSIGQAQVVATPVAVDGKCNGNRPDYYRFPAHQEQQISLEVVAGRLGSSMDPLVRLLDCDGNEMKMEDDSPGLSGDCRFQYLFSTAGDYIIEISDSRHQAGGVYRLRIGDFPIITAPLPLGGRLGSTAQFRFTDRAQPTIVRLPDSVPSGRLGISVKRPDGAASAMTTIAVSDLPERVEKEPNNRLTEATQVTLPCAVSGIFQTSHDRDHYEFVSVQGQRVDFTGYGHTFGTPAYPMLQLFNADNKLVAESKVTDSDELKLSYNIPAKGTYRLAVHDLLNRGGVEFAYRVEMQSGPDFSLVFKHDGKTKFNLPHQDSAFALVVQAQRRGYDGPIRIELETAESGIKIYNDTIAAKTNEVKLHLTLPRKWSEGDFHALRFVGFADRDGRKIRRIVRTESTLRAQIPQLLTPFHWHDGLILVTTAAQLESFFTTQSEQKLVTFTQGAKQSDYSFTLVRKQAAFKGQLAVYTEGLPPGFQASVKTEKNKITVTIAGDPSATVGETRLQFVSIG
ncbi:MAG: hypothetical protein ABGX16_01065, partial [Pirellulales bacterium]